MFSALLALFAVFLVTIYITFKFVLTMCIFPLNNIIKRESYSPPNSDEGREFSWVARYI
ncbi:hypothetical protein EC2788150_2101 [Escherichia coli 2788150]|nr:hypothetical protein EC2788150_2101 [Escherichia coli 2788150]